MSIIRVSRFALCWVVVSIVLAVPAPGGAHDLVVVRAESLNQLFDGMEAISKAAGREFNREQVLGMGNAMLGNDPASFLALDRPVAAVLPVAGMMMPQTSVVVALPVTDADAAIEALASQYADHAVEGNLHTLTGEQGPPLYLTAADGYLKVGGSSDLLTRVDPLAGGSTGSTLSAELFLEPIAPMVDAFLHTAKAKMVSELQTEDEAALPYDPAAMGEFFDIYLDAIRWLLANTSSLRLRVDVEDGYVRFAEDLIPKPESDLAEFIGAQKGGLPEIAKLADRNSAWYMAGQLALTEDHREGLKGFTDSYMDFVGSMLATQTESDDDTDETSGSPEADAMAFWSEYMAVMAPWADRWIECFRGDMVASFDFRPGRPFEFTEAFGMVDSDACRNLVSEMNAELMAAAESAEEISDVMTFARGPEVAGSETLVMTFDMVEMLDEMGQETDDRTEAMMRSMYGEQMSAAMVTAGDLVLAAGGSAPVERLGELAAALTAPAEAPTFSPLDVRPGLMFAFNVGAMLSSMKDVIPEGAVALDGAAARLSGEAGRVPMALTFASGMATFDMAVSLEAIEVAAAIAEEERARKAEAESATPEG